MTMVVMPANCTGAWVGYLAGRYEGQLGHLYSPGAQRGPFPFLPYALDNGAYGAFTSGEPWDVAAWRALLGWAQGCGQSPLWALVPDVVGQKAATIDLWHQYAAEVKASGFRPAFAVQDGMLPEDVPTDAEVIFVGGGHGLEVGHGRHVVRRLPLGSHRPSEHPALAARRGQAWRPQRGRHWLVPGRQSAGRGVAAVPRRAGGRGAGPGTATHLPSTRG